MTLKELVLSWDNAWRYDYWWRQKHNIAFNSPAHRAANQLDIAFEYQENDLSAKAINKLQKEDEKAKMRENGQWMIKDKTQDDELFKKIDLSEF